MERKVEVAKTPDGEFALRNGRKKSLEKKKA